MNSANKDGGEHAPPAFDSKFLQQHRNSADSEFNNKGNRKLKPAKEKKNEDEASDNSSKSLEEMALAQGSKKNLHRRARSSVGTNRKVSATREGKSNR